jgi:YVTN family beta-propeller protein
LTIPSPGDFVVKSMLALAPLLSLSLLAAPPTPAPTPARALLVLEKEQNTLVIIDPSSLAIVARVPAGNDPHEVAVSDDGRTAYVSNYGGRGGGPGGATITPIDLVAQKALAPIALGALRAPHGLAFAGGKLYFTAEQAKIVGRYDPATHAIDWVIGTGEDRTHMVAVSRDATIVFTSNVNSPSVSIIEQRALPAPGGPPPGAPNGPPPGGRPSGPPPNGGPPRSPQLDWHVTNVRVGRGAEGMDITPDARELWVANAIDATISIINVPEHKVVQTIPSTTSANRLKLTPDGKYALVSDLSGGDFLIVDVKSRGIVKRIALGGNSEGILVSPDGTRAYTTMNSKDAVAVIDLNTMTKTSEVKTGKGPDGLAWAERK